MKEVPLAEINLITGLPEDEEHMPLMEPPQLVRKISRYDEEEKRSKSTAPVNAALT